MSVSKSVSRSVSRLVSQSVSQSVIKTHFPLVISSDLTFQIQRFSQNPDLSDNTHTHTVSVVLQASVVRQLRAGEPSKLRDLMRSWKVLVKPSGNQERKLMYTPQRSEFTVRSQGYIPAEALTNHMMCSHEVDPVFFFFPGSVRNIVWPLPEIWHLTLKASSNEKR